MNLIKRLLTFILQKPFSTEKVTCTFVVHSIVVGTEVTKITKRLHSYIS